MDQAALGLRREFLIKGIEDKLVKAYYDYMVDIAVLFGAKRETAATELKESLTFEIALANVSLRIYLKIDFNFLNFVSSRFPCQMKRDVTLLPFIIQ